MPTNRIVRRRLHEVREPTPRRWLLPRRQIAGLWRSGVHLEEQRLNRPERIEWIFLEVRVLACSDSLGEFDEDHGQFLKPIRQGLEAVGLETGRTEGRLPSSRSSSTSSLLVIRVRMTSSMGSLISSWSWSMCWGERSHGVGTSK